MFTQISAITGPNTLGKDQRLKSRKLIGQLFDAGKAISVFPLRVLYMAVNDAPGTVQAGFSVSSRTFKKATDRNRIKRLLRECYRTQRQPLNDLATNTGVQLSLFFIFTGKELPDYLLIKEKMAAALEALMKKTTR